MNRQTDIIKNFLTSEQTTYSGCNTEKRLACLIGFTFFPDANTARNRQESMEAARIRMQQQHDAKAEKFAEEQKKVSILETGEVVFSFSLHASICDFGVNCLLSRILGQ